MTIAAEYAKALYALVARLPLGDKRGQEENEKEGKAYLKNLRQALERRGHIKLLPQIFSEYKKLAMAHERFELHKKVTPESERTRTLLELYKRLVASGK
ncbi:MAG TPA: hypothetical protein VMV71_03415 [Candidatus Paceibacterota bacterium]|nr:hypothetical protein [Candidatus Paceibacterota bacterium]